MNEKRRAGTPAPPCTARRKSLAEFAPAGANKVQNIFAGGVYVGKNTSRLANVRAKRVRCGEPQPLQTRAQRSGSRLRACQKYFFDTLCGASFGMRRSVCRAFSLTAVSFACRIVSEGGILYNAAAAAAKRSPREAGSAPGAARRSRRAVKNNKLTKGRRPYENSVQKAP